MKLVAIVLTLNESHHLPRCLQSLYGTADEVLVVDSFSNDSTTTIAETLGARVVTHRFLNHANQFNWALAQLDPDTNWVLRIDADEYLTPELATEIRHRLPTVYDQVDGIFLRRRIKFQGKAIRYGGVFPIQVLRVFRFGRGRCEDRWMDEHIQVEGRTEVFSGELIDDNRNSLTWWTDKHNRYSSLEAAEMLNLEFNFLERDEDARYSLAGPTHSKRWLKENIYARLPTGSRALLYFLYRFVLRLGFLDGAAGTRFHFLQGFWYRYLVDLKVKEVKALMDQTSVDVETAIEEVLHLKLK